RSSRSARTASGRPTRSRTGRTRSLHPSSCGGYSCVTLRVSRYAGNVQTRLPRTVREQQMLDAAVAVFSASGFHAASMAEIAARAGISKPMVYAYLGTKEELFVVCLHREGTRLMEAIAGVVEPNLPPDEQLW